MTTTLYKYFPTDADKLERFINCQVYLTPPKYFNDPWDFRPRSEPPTHEQIQQIVKETGAKLSSHGLRDFHKEVNGPNYLEDEAQEQQNGLSELVGLVCLTEKHLDRLMWSHYGDSHRGFVAEFRCTEFEYTEGDAQAFSTCLSPFGRTGAMKVQYLPEQPVRKHDGSNLKEVFWTKHDVWRYEQEWRIVEDLRKADPHPKREGFFLLWFKPTDLVRVIVGLKVCQEVKFQLRQMLNHREFDHVCKEQACINPGSRELDTRPLSW
jgi:hypothetical protein